MTGNSEAIIKMKDTFGYMKFCMCGKDTITKLK